MHNKILGGNMKKQSKKRILSILLSIVLVLTSLPLNAFAAENDALKLSKTVSGPNENGEYTLTLEAFTTGSVTTTTTSTPLDIILVLDQSASMKGKNQTKLETAAKHFIGIVAENYSESGNHRMAIVEFDSSSADLTEGFIDVKDNKDQLNTIIDNLSPNGATRVDYGMSTANDILEDTGYNGKGREKIVIVFADGQPTSSSEFNLSVANDAIEEAKAMKDNGIKVYSIGIFNGADPTVITGGADANVGTSWEKNGFLGIGGNDTPASNRFMNFLSSNSLDATSLGLKVVTVGITGLMGSKWKITEAPTWTNAGYYKIATTTDDLISIFKSITDTIITPSISLDETTILKDIISDDFELPADFVLEDIKVQTAEVDTISGDTYTWKAPTDLTFEPTVDGKTVEVTGFNYDKNVVIDNNGTVSGSKLIVTIPIVPKEGHQGGNDIFTNDRNSGIYSGNALVKPFISPTVDLPFKYTVTYTDGVEGEEIFADEVTTGLLTGTSTPTFAGATTRTGYVFYGWNPEVAKTVTGDATYTATWEEDINGNEIADKD